MSEMMFVDFEKKLKSKRIEAFRINKGNQQIFEYVKNKKFQEKPTKIYSVTKSIVSLLIGIMVDKGYIKSIDEPIHNYFPEILKLNEIQKQDITIFHLLTMTSGLKVMNFQGSKNWVKTILEQPIVHSPGSTFQYNSGDSHLLSAIIKKGSGMSTAAFAEKYLFGPLGIRKYNWVADPQGIHGGGFSLFLNLDDMEKIGFLLLNKGKVDSNQVISSDWILQAKSPYRQVESANEGIYGYGYQFWTFENIDPESPLNYFYVSGLFGQYIFIVPKLDIVAVVKSQLSLEQQSAPKLYFEEWLRSVEDYRRA